nr:hypothetical protein Q903MT_gene6218 [Picea sitchensis]
MDCCVFLYLPISFSTKKPVTQSRKPVTRSNGTVRKDIRSAKKASHPVTQSRKPVTQFHGTVRPVLCPSSSAR